MNVTRIEADSVMLDVSLHEPVEQRVSSQHVVVSESGVKLYPVQIRYAFPPELDLMARLAGMTLRERWAGWKREPFTSESRQHVSVWAKPRD